MKQKLKRIIARHGLQRLIIILLLLPSSLTAQDSTVRLSMSFANESLPAVLLRLEKASDYHFLFTYDDLLPLHVNGQVSEATFFEVLDYVLSDKPVEYSTDGKFISVTLKEDTTKAEGNKLQSVGGFVTDEKGEPLPGAQVRVVGTDVAAITDVNGAFHFDYFVNTGGQVQATFMGMEPTTIPLQKEMSIRMKSDEKLMRQVVVTGIFTKPKQSYTGAVSTITAEQIQLYKGQNLLQTLKNIDASINFQIDNINGSNPNNLPNINIRGNASLPTNVQEFNEGLQNSTNQPLIIMDGFEITLTKLMDYNDDEIESINILKDAAATAIYGSRGANGVIVVVTKRPEPGRLKINLEAGTTIEVPDLNSYHLLDAAQKLQLEYAAGLYDYPDGPSTQISRRTIYNQRLRRVLSGADTDWLSKPVRTGVGQVYRARLEGGSEEFRWGASLSYNDTEGAMKGSRRRTFNGGITLMYNLKNLVFRNYTSFGTNKADESKYGSFSTYANQQPYNTPYDEDGHLVRTFAAFYGGSTVANPLFDASLNTLNTSGYNSITNQFSIDWNILPELRLRGSFGVGSTQSTSDKFLPPEHSTFTTNSQYSTDDGFLRRGSYTYGTGRSTNYELDLTLAYNKVFADRHQLYAGVDYSVRQSSGYSYLFQAEGFSSDHITSIMNARQYAQNSTPSGSKSLSRQLGFTGNVNYTYDDRYYIDLSYRIDGSSEYGSNKKFAPFWSAGVGWNLHHERFLRDVRAINLLKLRASFGETGSQLSSNAGAFTSYQYITNNKYMNWVGAQLTGLGNYDLTWQTTRETDIGLEFGLWKDRLKGTVDFYDKTTSNLLSYMDMPLSTGFASYMANIGEVKNRGVELYLSAYLIRNPKKHFNWIVSGQLMYNTNWISKLSEAVKEQNRQYMEQGSDVSTLFFEGDPTNSIYAVQSLGIDPSTGKELYIDKDGNQTTTWNASDKVFIGRADQPYRGNIGTTVVWKKLTFNCSFGYYWGGYAYNQTLLDKVEVTLSTIQNQNVDERVLSSRWFQPGDVTFFKGLSNEDTHATSRYVMRDNVFQLSSLGVQYRFDSDRLRRKLRCNALTLAMNMSDLFYLSTIRRERGTSYPYARNIQGSVKLSF